MKDDILRNDVNGDLHVFVACHGRVIVKVIGVTDKEAIIGSRYVDVEQIFCCYEAGAMCCGDAWKIEFFTTHGDPDAMGVYLVRFNDGDKS